MSVFFYTGVESCIELLGQAYHLLQELHAEVVTDGLAFVGAEDRFVVVKVLLQGGAVLLFEGGQEVGLDFVNVFDFDLRQIMMPESFQQREASGFRRSHVIRENLLKVLEDSFFEVFTQSDEVGRLENRPQRLF